MARVRVGAMWSVLVRRTTFPAGRCRGMPFVQIWRFTRVSNQPMWTGAHICGQPMDLMVDFVEVRLLALRRVLADANLERSEASRAQ